MAFILPRGAEREYLTAYRLVAVYVAKMPTGDAKAGTSRDLLHSLIAIRRRHVGAAIVAAYWAKDAGDAQLIRGEIERGSEGVLMTARALQARIELAAARRNVMLTDHATIMERVRMAVDYVEGRIAQAQAAGELRWFNQAYRAWRLEAKAQGRVMTYAEARARLRRSVYRQILFGETGEIVVMPKLFPPLASPLDKSTETALSSRPCAALTGASRDDAAAATT
jgi:hypothetical protein